MATRKSTTSSRSRRNTLSLEYPGKAKLRAALEAERRHLQQVHSLLGCIVVAFDGGTDVRDVDYADAIEATRSLVGGAVDRLDLVNLSRLRSTEK